jgi:hypothetical protein
MKLHGRVTDFEGRPLHDALVNVLGRGFERDIATVSTDEYGMYEVELESGTYLAVWICKDYKEKMLEYWAWHVPVYNDLEMNARVDGLELYGVNAFWPRQRSTVMVFFRPMSLKRYKAHGSTDDFGPGLIPLCPNLSPEDIEITIDGAPAPLLCVSKVREEAPPDQYSDAYLAHVEAEGIQETDAYRKINVAIVDRETGERGEGSVFWRHTLHQE